VRTHAHLEESSLIFLAFVVPLAVYCLVLSFINRGRHPVFVPGSWDFAGVLFAASGFLVFGGPAILTSTHEHWRLSWLLGRTRTLQGIGENWSFWISLWFLYFVIIAGSSAFVLWRRRALTSIYNIEPALFATVLTDVLDRLGLERLQNGPRRLLLRFRQPAIGSVGSSTSAYPWAELAVEPFPAMRHVSLHWLSHDEAIRLEVEIELAKALAQVPTNQSPVAGWFLSLSLGLFFSALFVLLVILRILQFPR
jgi:hypothetical protein